MAAARGASKYLAAALILAFAALLGAAGPAAAQVLPLPPDPTGPLPVPVVPPSAPAALPAQHPCSPYPLCLVVPTTRVRRRRRPWITRTRTCRSCRYRTTQDTTRM